MPDQYLTLILIASTLFAFGMLMLIVKRYKRCPSNRVLVVYGRVHGGASAKCIHGGGTFVWPLIQDFQFLSLDPMQIEIPLRGALSTENIRVNVPSVFTVAVGTEPAVMQNAAERLLGLGNKEVMKQAEDIIFGQLRQVIASMAIDEINRDRDKFLDKIHESLGPELEKIGLVLINVNITDITDESGYIEAIGKKAASQAIQQAEIDVAEQQRRGAIGVAEAEKERMISVAQASRSREIGTKQAEREQAVRIAELDKETEVGRRQATFEQETQVKAAELAMRVQVAEADASAVTGENEAQQRVAESDMTLKIKQAETYEAAERRRREADAGVREAQYVAEARAAEAMGLKIEKEQRAELEARAKAEKARIIVDAEAAAERVRLEAEARAAATFVQLEAQARGDYEILAKKAEGLGRLVERCGGAQEAFQLLMLEQLPQLAETAAKAIANVKFDKIVVWDSGKEGGATAGFLKSLAGSLPPMLHMMRDVGGVRMPEFLGELTSSVDAVGAGNGESSESKPAPEAPPAKKG